MQRVCSSSDSTGVSAQAGGTAALVLIVGISIGVDEWT